MLVSEKDLQEQMGNGGVEVRASGGRMGENDQGAVRSGSGSDVTVPKAMSKSHYARGLKRKAETELRAQKRETNRYSLGQSL